MNCHGQIAVKRSVHLYAHMFFQTYEWSDKVLFLKKIQLKSVKLIFLYIESKKLYRKPGPSPQEATVARKTLEQDQAHMRVPPLMIVSWVETEEKEGGQIRREEYINYNKLSV